MCSQSEEFFAPEDKPDGVRDVQVSGTGLNVELEELADFKMEVKRGYGTEGLEAAILFSHHHYRFLYPLQPPTKHVVSRSLESNNCIQT